MSEMTEKNKINFEVNLSNLKSNLKQHRLDTQLKLKSIFCEFLRATHDASIVYQNMQIAFDFVELSGKLSDGLHRGQIQLQKENFVASTDVFDLLHRFFSFFRIATRDVNFSTPSSLNVLK